MIELIWTSGIALPPQELQMKLNGALPASTAANTVWTNAFTNGTNAASSAFQSYQNFYCGYQPNVNLNIGQTRVILNGVISLTNTANLYIMNKFECQSITFNTTGTEVIPGPVANASQQNLVGTAFWVKPFTTINNNINNIGIIPTTIRASMLYASEVDPATNSFRVYGETGRFNWLVHGKRFDIEVEPNKADVNRHGDGPYTYLTQKKRN